MLNVIKHFKFKIRPATYGCTLNLVISNRNGSLIYAPLNKLSR